MGLSASQARLLTITSRKSDCEFQSMRLSHEKIALSRSMTDISNEYQNALDQTKLVYDFYGTNDKSMDVTYGLLMQPSEVNGYMPIITTDATGKVVLDSKYAQAAKAAGIPTEGLGCLPSDLLRNRFLEKLGAVGIITPTAAEAYQAVPYSQTVGIGDIETVNAVTTNMKYDQLVDQFQETLLGLSNGLTCPANAGGTQNGTLRILKDTEVAGPVTLGDLLKGEDDYTIVYYVEANGSDEETGDHTWNQNAAEMNGAESIALWWKTGEGNTILNYLRDALGKTSPQAQTAIQYADTMIEQIYDLGVNGAAAASQIRNGGLSNVGGYDDKWFYNTGDNISQKGQNREAARLFVNDSKVVYGASNIIGYYARTTRTNDPCDAQRETLSMNITNMLKAYLTYFADMMSGMNGKYYVTESSVLSTGNTNHHVRSMSKQRTVRESKLVGNEVNGEQLDFEFNVRVDQTVNTSDALMSSFYDAMFNQICMRGWVENDNVNNKDYLQDMFKNGMMFVTAPSDDGYYYQNNYGSFSYIKEVADDEAIARAEAKYNTEKAKLNHKEEVLDLKMKNLDTEISSLTTEYDTIKSLISKNIERGFKRYDA